MMRWLYKLPLRFRTLFRKSHVEQELSDELRFHLEKLIEENLAKGMGPEEARYAALRDLGGFEQIKEECRDMRRVNYIENFLQDVSYGLRVLAKKPGFTFVAVLSLALGIGANTALFSLVDAVLLKTLPVQRPDELVLLDESGGPGTVQYFPYPVFQQMSTESRVITGMLASFDADGTLRVSVRISGGGTTAELAQAQLVSGNYYSVLGVNAILGRTITPEDDKVPGGHPVAVISHAYWESRFEHDPSVVGKTITVNGHPFTIIGVTPQEFFGITPGHPPDVTIPLMMQAQVWLAPGQAIVNDQRFGWLRLMARLKPGVAENLARAALTTRLQQFEIRSAGSVLSAEDRHAFLQHAVQFASASKGLDSLRRQFSKPLLILITIVGLVLLIACANVAILLLARAIERQREFAVRLALGAGRLRLIRQLLTESVLLSSTGGALGCLLAYWARNVLLSLISRSPLPISLHAPLDSRILSFSIGLSLFTGLLFGLAPALQSTRAEIAPAVVGGSVSRESTGRRFWSSLAQLLVSFQFALSLVLLVGAGLFLRSLSKLNRLDAGFSRDNLLLVSVDPTMVGYKGTQVLDFYDEVLNRVASLPGVHSAALSSHSLLSGGVDDAGFAVAGYTPRPGDARGVNLNLVSPGFFRLMGIRILLGREFELRDNRNAPPVAVISEAVAQQYFGSENPVGKTFGWGGPSENTRVEIIGVARNVKWDSLRNEGARIVYLPFQQNPPWHDPLGQVTFEVRTERTALSMVAPVRQQFQSIDKSIPVFDIKTQNEQTEESLIQEHLLAALSAGFGVLALALAIVGLYGTLSNDVIRRTHEIGTRIALGARSANVVWSVLAQVLRLVLIGVAVGLLGTWSISRLVDSLLFGLTPTDPGTIGVATLLLAVTAILAGYVPARRASKVDAAVALRHE